MSQTPQQRNWERILAEMDQAISDLEGPVPEGAWDEFGGDSAREAFRKAMTAVLSAELANRMGDTSKVNVDISTALRVLGEQLAEGYAAQERGATNDA